MYTNNKVDFTKDWLKDLTALSLMVWWLDDGGKIGEGARKGKWSTQGWGLDGNNALKQILKEKWDIDCFIVKMVSTVSGEDQYYLELRQNNLKKLLRIIMPYIPVKTFVYKAFLTYKNQSLQESWIAEMKKLMKEEFHPQIDFLLKQSKKVEFLDEKETEVSVFVDENELAD
jgi:LAGLIDADG DNA endonuclease family protein